MNNVVKCPVCEGSTAYYAHGVYNLPSVSTCHACNGKGWLVSVKWSECEDRTTWQEGNGLPGRETWT